MRGAAGRGVYRGGLRQGACYRASALAALADRACRKKPPTPNRLLQEWAQGQGLELPVYAEVLREGPDHAPRFTAEVRIRGQKPARGNGTSKRAAEQAAATALLGARRCQKRRARMKSATPTLPSARRRTGPSFPRAEQKFGFVAIIGAPNAGKSTPGQYARRRQGDDRQPQGADDPGARARHCDRGRRANSFSSIRPASSRPSAGWTARWSARPGAGRRTPISWC